MTRTALCAQADPEIFFPDHGGSARAARRICLLCTIREECLAYAMAPGRRRVLEGIWGGYTTHERRHGLRCNRGHDLQIAGITENGCQTCHQPRQTQATA